jgi:Uma2 family endonuclease
MARQTLYTADDLEKLSAEGKRYELVRGELLEMPPTNWKHGVATMRLSRLIANYVEEHDLGVTTAAETGFLISRDPDTVRAPDCAFVSKARLPEDPETVVFAELAPDLVIEVASPSQSFPYLQAKVEDWLDAGVKAVWVVLPERRSVSIYAVGTHRFLHDEDTLDGGDVLPGFSCGVKDIFK